jgi:hypothetical protein
LIVFMRCEFVKEVFKIEPYYSHLDEIMSMHVQITEPPGKVNCKYSLSDPKNRTIMYTKDFAKDLLLNDDSIYNIKFYMEVYGVNFTNNYYALDFECQYICEVNHTHRITQQTYLIVSSPEEKKNHIDFNVNYVNDNTLEILDYAEKSLPEKKLILEKKINEFYNDTEDTNTYLQQSILLSSLLSVTNTSLDFLRNSQERVTDKLAQVLKCETLKSIIFGNDEPDKIFSLSAASLLYQTSNSELYINQTLLKISNISQCLSEQGSIFFDELNEKLKTKSELFKNVTEDYIKAVTASSSNNLEVLKKVYKSTTSGKNDSLVVDSTTLKIKSLIEDNSLLLSKNKYIKFQNDTIVTDNFVLMNKKYEPIKLEKRNLQFNNQEQEYNTFEIDNNATKINISLPINYMIDRYSLKSAKIGAILYKKFPLLSYDNKNFSENVITLKLYNHLDEEQSVKDLGFPINLLFNRTSPSFNFCLYYDTVNQTWSDKNCKVVELSESQILCQCTHLTDFTISNFNPAAIIDDIIHILNDTNWMTDLEEFKYLNAENAIVIYIYCFIILNYAVGMYFTVAYDKSKDSYFYDQTYIERPTICGKICSKKKIVLDLIYMKKQTGKLLETQTKQSGDETYINKSYNEIEEHSSNSDIQIENFEVLEFKKNLYTSFNLHDENNLLSQTHIDKESTCESQSPKMYIHIMVALKIIQQYNLYTALFIDLDYKLVKSDVLTVIFFSITTSFAVCGLFSPSNSVTGDSKVASDGYIFSNRSLGVSIITLFIVKIPFIILKIILKKQIIFKGENYDKLKIKSKFFYRHIVVYTIMFVFFIWGILNTQWIFLRNLRIGRENVFIYYYFTTLISKFIIIFFMLWIKALLLFVIFRNSEVPIWKIVLIPIVLIIIALY